MGGCCQDPQGMHSLSTVSPGPSTFWPSDVHDWTWIFPVYNHSSSFFHPVILIQFKYGFFCYTQIKKFHVDYPISDKEFLFQATFLHVQIAGSSQRAGSSPTVLWLQHSTEFQLGCAAPNTCFCPEKMLLPPPRPLPDSQLRTGHSTPMTYFLEIYSLSSPSSQYTSSNH